MTTDYKRDTYKTKRPPAALRILDILFTDGGWMSVPAIEAASYYVPFTIGRALNGLRAIGAVESRTVELACIRSKHDLGRGTSKIESYTEWRALVDWLED